MHKIVQLNYILDRLNSFAGRRQRPLVRAICFKLGRFEFCEDLKLCNLIIRLGECHSKSGDHCHLKPICSLEGCIDNSNTDQEWHSFTNGGGSGSLRLNADLRGKLTQLGWHRSWESCSATIYFPFADHLPFEFFSLIIQQVTRVWSKSINLITNKQ